MEENKETVVEENIEEVNEETQEETKESLLSKIGNKLKSALGTETEEETQVVIPDEFNQVAATLGWSTEDIQEFASDYTEDELKEMIPFLTGEDSSEEEETSDTQKTEETKKNEDENSQDDELVQKLLDRIEKLEKAQEESQEDLQVQEAVDLVNRASEMFDEASDEFEIFGKTDDLPKFPDGRTIPNSPQMKARSEVWDVAYRLKGAGLDFDQAMSVALNSYKGKNLTKDVQRKVIRDLKKNEKRLGGKRTSHESSPVEFDRGPDVIENVLRKHGKA